MLPLTGDNECLVWPHRVDVPHGDGGEHTTHLGQHQHGSAIYAQIYAMQIMQNALRRRELNQLNVCQSELRSVRQTKFDRSVFIKFNCHKFTILTLTVKKPKGDSPSYALFAAPAGERPFCRGALCSLLQVSK